MNENAKVPAFFSALPEADHNELGGLGQGQAGSRRPGLRPAPGRDQHPRERRRIELTGEVIEPQAACGRLRVEAEGETRTARVLELVMLGDLLSLELAARRGVDPGPIDAIDELKRKMGDP